MQSYKVQISVCISLCCPYTIERIGSKTNCPRQSEIAMPILYWIADGTAQKNKWCTTLSNRKLPSFRSPGAQKKNMVLVKLIFEICIIFALIIINNINKQFLIQHAICNSEAFF